MTTTTPRVYKRQDEPPPAHPVYVAFWETHSRYQPRDEWEQMWAVLKQPAEVPLSEEQLAYLERRSVPDPIPPCSVCGRALSVGSSTRGQYEYVCDGKIPDPERGENWIKDDPEWDPMNTSIGLSMHRFWSTFMQGNPGDALAARLLKEIRRLRTIEGVGSQS